MREKDPLFFGEDLHQLLLDLHRVGLFDQIEPARDALHVRIDHDTGRDAVGRRSPPVDLHHHHLRANEITVHYVRHGSGFPLVLLQPGNKLPVIRKIAKEFKVSVLTVNKSYRWLRARGVVNTRRGVGARGALSLDPSGEHARLRAQINKFVDKVMAQAASLRFDPMTVAQAALHRATASARDRCR